MTDLNCRYRRVEGDLCSGGDEYRFEPDRILCPSKGTFLVNVCQSHTHTPTTPGNSTALMSHSHLCAVPVFFADGFKKKKGFYPNGTHASISRGFL